MQKAVIVSISITSVGVILVLLGSILGWVFLPNFIESTIKKQAQLKNGTEMFEKWVDIPIPIYIKFYFFNVTNADKFLAGVGGDWSTKPEVEELGPYIYRQTRVKYEIESHPERDTISYRQNITYHFEPEMSTGSETDFVYVINSPLLAVATILATVDESILPRALSREILSFMMSPLSRERFLMPAIVKDILFGKRLNFIYDTFISIAKDVLGIELPPELADGKFGAYLNKNGTNADGLWEIYSGGQDYKKIGQLKSINGKSDVEGAWKGDCNNIKGSDGSFFPPLLKKDTPLSAFSPDVCRSVDVTFDSEVKFKGIPAFRFVALKTMFASGKTHPPNDCYCMPIPSPLNGTCDFDGVTRMFSCAPAVISKPHFLDADDFILESVVGLKPDRALHETFMDVEPVKEI
ncbi:scavenger receptor class B member 1 [Folsomia candida]|uniref:scavenger receptor class B member 1 n=1 Tax=Folsomia candida TaxID=158441 RepID=UPI001605018F|nr:scavenger receptor class B member 1 [Folsomia candida]